MGRRRRAAAACMALLAVASGCTSSSGLLFRPGPHRLLPSAQRVGQAARAPLQLPREMDKQVLAEYRVEPGDVLLIEPTDAAAAIRLPGDQPVMPDGRIDLGGYGGLEVAGMTVDQIRAEVEALVGRQAKKRQPISVRLVDPESHVYYVLGEVNSPGAYSLKGRETVLDAIVMAGDLTDRANRHKILLTRPTAPDSCRIVLPICYRRIVQLGDTSTNYQVLPGDRIFVASLKFCEEFLQTCFPGGDGGTCTRCDRAEVPCSAAAIESDIESVDALPAAQDTAADRLPP